MKLKGFTLAEVLITMAIIGVIASMTLPALNTNMLKQQAGSGLMKGINELQQATMLLLRENNARSLASIGLRNINSDIVPAAVATRTCDNVATYLNCVTIREGTNRTSGLKLTESTLPSYRNFALANYAINTTSLTYQSSDGISYTGIDQVGNVSRFLVDINGNKLPNIIGKDAFIVGVMRNGNIVPYGGREWIASIGAVADACANNTTPTTGESCAGAIADNNGQVRYRF